MTARIGLIGLGRFAQKNVIPGIRRAQNVELAAIYDQSAPAVDAVAATLPPGAVCNSAAELIQRRDLDLIYVATPSGAHKELVESIIGARRHVMCEKPLTINYNEASYLASLAKKAGLIASVDHEMRYYKVYREMRDRVRDGYIGNTVLCSMNFSSDYSVNPSYPGTYYWDFGSLRSHSGGLLRQALSHFVDLYQFMFGGIEPNGGYCATMVKAKPERIERTTPTGEKVFSPGPLREVDVDDAVALSGRLLNGAPASITATWSAPVRLGTRWVVQGSEGVLIYQSGTEMGGLWGGSLEGARNGEAISTLPLADDLLNDPATPSNYLSVLVGAQVEDVVRVIGGGSDGIFATFQSECEVWKAIETWSS